MKDKKITITLLGLEEFPNYKVKPSVAIDVEGEWDDDDIPGVVLRAYEDVVENFLAHHKCGGGDACPSVQLHKRVVEAKCKIALNIEEEIIKTGI